MISHAEILEHLTEQNPEKRAHLRQRADRLRWETVGDAVHLRGLIEISNHCRRNCLYCGVRAGREDVRRYRMTLDEILDSARLAQEFGYGTVVLQAGEDGGLSTEFIAQAAAAIKEKYHLAVTLSLGEQPDTVFRRWREAGADRYLLRFETSNPKLFEAIHPHQPGRGVPKTSDRIAMLRRLREMGYEIGSGVMIGIPGQTPEDLARDLELFAELDLDMIGTGPYLPHPATPLGIASEAVSAGLHENPEKWEEFERTTGFYYPVTNGQMPNSIEAGFTVIALTRLICPDANIPSTTAVATLDGVGGRISGLQSGANVIMPNLTPMKYRALYEIYPHKAAALETAEVTHRTALCQIAEAGRIPGRGPGSRINR